MSEDQWSWEKVWLLTNTATGNGYWQWDIRYGQGRRFFGYATDEEMAEAMVSVLNEHFTPARRTQAG